MLSFRYLPCTFLISELVSDLLLISFGEGEERYFAMMNQLPGNAALKQPFKQGMLSGHYRNDIDIIFIDVIQYTGFNMFTFDHMIGMRDPLKILFQEFCFTHGSGM